MKNWLILFCLSFYTGMAICQVVKTESAFNFGFEKKVSNEKLPMFWFQWGTKDYSLKIDTIEKHSGKNSLLIEPSTETSQNSFGCIANEVPANYEGKELEIKAYMKFKNVRKGFIGLLIRIDGTSGVLEFDNMMKKKIRGTADWEQYSIKLAYPKNAKTIYIGALLSGTGRLWVDDFELFIDGKEITQAEIKKAFDSKASQDNEFDTGSGISTIHLTESKIEDLVVLAEVWGFLKYYHPKVAVGEYNWDYELFRIMPKVLNAKNSSERNNLLAVWVESLGRINAEKKSEFVNIKISPDLSWINNFVLGDQLTMQLKTIKNAERTDEHFYIGLQQAGNAEFKNESPYYMEYPDVGFRLLCLYRYWNIIQYYFPYKNLIEEDWKNVLMEYIPIFTNAANELEYKKIVLSLMTRIHDTHANIMSVDAILTNYKGINYAPVKITFIENRAVVSSYYDKSLGEDSGLRIGDIIESINNKMVKEIVSEKLPYTPGSNYSTQLRDIATDLLRTNDSLLTIEFKRGNSKITTQIKCYYPTGKMLSNSYLKKDTCFNLLSPDIAYLYLGSVKSEYLTEIIPNILDTKGLILDLRCYPSDFIVFSLSDYLLPKPTNFVKYSKGSIISPGLFTITEAEKVGNRNKNFYRGKIMIIVNETTQSSAEYHAMAFRVAPHAKVIGSTTAGTNGNISKFMLPGGISTAISGIGIYYPDGRETQRVGIVPDIEVKPTINGIKLGKDELLEKAIEIINKK